MKKPSRVESVDALRGLIMVVMALDHTRDLIHGGAMFFSPEDLSRTTPILFFTRWVTHICAPTFMFLAGVGASLRLQADGSKPQLSRFLWSRGLWLILLEVTVVRLALNLSSDLGNPIFLLVLEALGISMIALSALLYLPRMWLLALSGAMILLHNLLDSIMAPQSGWLSPTWHLLHQPGSFALGSLVFIVSYPVVPWTGVMSVGFLFGDVLRFEPSRRHRLTMLLGVSLSLGFLLVRGVNLYGDPRPWAHQESAVLTALSFLRTTKYPPSLEFLLMTLGPALILLALFERADGPLRKGLIVVGRVPLFFYVVHFWLIRLVGLALAWVRYGQASLAFMFHPLPSTLGPAELYPPGFGYRLRVVYLVWISIVLGLYPACRWFSGVKRRHREWWWLSYL